MKLKMAINLTHACRLDGLYAGDSSLEMDYGDVLYRIQVRPCPLSMPATPANDSHRCLPRAALHTTACMLSTAEG